MPGPLATFTVGLRPRGGGGRRWERAGGRQAGGRRDNPGVARAGLGEAVCSGAGPAVGVRPGEEGRRGSGGRSTPCFSSLHGTLRLRTQERRQQVGAACRVPQGLSALGPHGLPRELPAQEATPGLNENPTQSQRWLSAAHRTVDPSPDLTMRGPGPPRLTRASSCSSASGGRCLACRGSSSWKMALGFSSSDSLSESGSLIQASRSRLQDTVRSHGGSGLHAWPWTLPSPWRQGREGWAVARGHSGQGRPGTPEPGQPPSPVLRLPPRFVGDSCQPTCFPGMAPGAGSAGPQEN